MLLIRPATVHDVALLRTMIRELAEYEHELDRVAIREEDLARDGFGEHPRFRALIAEWDGHAAGYALFFEYYSTWTGRGLFLEDLFVREAFRERGIGKRCWPQSRGRESRSSVTEYTGKCSTGMKRRSSCTCDWARPFAISGGRCCWPVRPSGDWRRRRFENWCFEDEEQ